MRSPHGRLGVSTEASSAPVGRLGPALLTQRLASAGELGAEEAGCTCNGLTPSSPCQWQVGELIQQD